jgi:hypothetical protein
VEAVRREWYACGVAAGKKRHQKTKTDPHLTEWRGDPAETGAFVYTFTFRLPFRMGISDNFDQELTWPSEYANPKDAQTFGKPPFVRLRLFNAEIADRKFSPANAPVAVQHFYDGDFELGPADDVDPHLYEQWVSLETPAVLLTGEDPADGGYAFHRGLAGLDAYLQAFALARNDNLVRPISSRELRPIVIIGRLSLDGDWALQGPILMHPDAKARPLLSRPVQEHTASLNKAMETMLRGNPFVRSWQWKARAEQRRYEGDNTDAVVSFQIAVEVLLFEVWALLLIDEGKSASEIRDLRRDTSFASLVKSELGHRLGGSWDTTRPRTPVGRYWRGLYELRIKVVHSGYLPHDGDADRGERAFEGLETFLDERLVTRAKRYPTAAGALRELAEVTGSNWAR